MVTAYVYICIDGVCLCAKKKKRRKLFSHQGIVLLAPSHHPQDTNSPHPIATYSLSTGVLQKHCSDAFMKQVLPRLHSPTRPSVVGHTSELRFLLFALEELSAALFSAMLPRGHLSVLGSRSSMNKRCPSTCTPDTHVNF